MRFFIPSLIFAHFCISPHKMLRKSLYGGRSMEQYLPRGKRTTPQGSAFARDVYRAFLDELQAMTSYVQGAVLLARHLPAVARLFDEIARVELSHYEQLGQLLLHLDITPSVNTRLRQEPPRFGLNATTEASLFARHTMHEKIKDEERGAAEYRRLASATDEKRERDMLLFLAEEELQHAAALQGMLERFERS